MEGGRLVAADVDREVRALLAVAEEELLDLPALVAEADEEAAGAVVAVELHDVPQDRPLADLDQRLGHALGLLAQPGAHPAREDDDRHPLDRGVAAAAHARPRQRRSASSAPVVEQLADALDALEARARGSRSSVRSCVRVGGEQLLDAALDGPLRLEAGQAARDLGERDAVGALVRAGALGQRDGRVGHGRLDHARDVADLVVVLVAADVEGLVVDRLARRLERGEEAARDVLDVGERPPRRAVALHPHLARRVGVGDEVVDHDVAAQAGRDAVGGGVAQVDGAEVVVGERRDVALGQHLGLAVGGDGVEGGRARRAASSPSAAP